MTGTCAVELDIELVLSPIVLGPTGIGAVIGLGDAPHSQFTDEVGVEETGWGGGAEAKLAVCLQLCAFLWWKQLTHMTNYLTWTCHL